MWLYLSFRDLLFLFCRDDIHFTGVRRRTIWTITNLQSTHTVLTKQKQTSLHYGTPQGDKVELLEPWAKRKAVLKQEAIKTGYSQMNKGFDCSGVFNLFHFRTKLWTYFLVRLMTEHLENTADTTDLTPGNPKMPALLHVVQGSTHYLPCPWPPIPAESPKHKFLEAAHKVKALNTFFNQIAFPRTVVNHSGDLCYTLTGSEFLFFKNIC